LDEDFSDDVAKLAQGDLPQLTRAIRRLILAMKCERMKETALVLMSMACSSINSMRLAAYHEMQFELLGETHDEKIPAEFVNPIAVERLKKRRSDLMEKCEDSCDTIGQIAEIKRAEFRSIIDSILSMAELAWHVSRENRAG